MEQMKYDVFISYSWEDVNIAKKIYDAIIDAGFKCCFDKETFHGGQDFPKVTSANICNSDIFLYLGSKNSFTSGWAPDEVAFAKSHKNRGKLLYYGIDNNKMPDWMDLAFAASNRRNIYEHSYKSVLIEDIRMMMGHSDDIVIKEVSQDSLSLSKKEFPLLNELRIRARDTQITLEQENILKLLMGFKLYQNPYACLRELYQNSLDACRRRLCAIDNKIHKGRIAFGIKDEKGKGTYLYCHDNGVGMDEYVIENYLLRIGDSYYNSDDFQQERLGMSSDFVPVSKFGIGIISCFMIASRIEVITKLTKPHSKTLFFCINNIQGNIYYDRNVPQEEKEMVDYGGTVVRILLKEPYVSEISNNKINKLWKTYIGHPYSGFYNQFASFLGYNYLIDSENELYKQYKKNEHNLFLLLSSFICRYPDDIDIVLENENKSSETHLTRLPFALQEGYLGFTMNDAHLLSSDLSKHDFEIRWKWCTIYHMERIQCEDVFFYPIVILPTKNFVIEKELIESPTDIFLKFTNMESTRIQSASEDNSDKYRTIIHNGGMPSSYVVGNGTTVDGIFVVSSQPSITSYGILDYTGKNKPCLSVDRIEIIQYPANNDVILETIESIFIQKYQELVEKHVNKYHLDNETKKSIEKLHFHSSGSDSEEANINRRTLRI